MKLKALIFNVDGTLANTERHGHLPACNEALARMGYPVQWTWDEFKTMHSIPADRVRMRRSLEQLALPLSKYNALLGTSHLDLALTELVNLKEKLYVEKYLPRLPLRPGVKALIEEALDRDVRLAIVSTCEEAQIHTLLHKRLGRIARYFDPILGKESGTKSAPDSALYRRCLSALDTRPEHTLVIEDSEAGVRAAQRAGLPCAVFYNDYTYGQNFAGAALVARSLDFFKLDQLVQLCQPKRVDYRLAYE